MLDGSSAFPPEEIRKIYEELDLHEKGITEEEITRRKTRIFVGGLKFASEDHVLHDYFATFGEIKEAVVIRDRKTGLSKGYGFVTMVEDIPALKAILDKSPKLDGRRCNVNLAYIGQKNKPQGKGAATQKIREVRHLPPQLCGYPNGIIASPSVIMAEGHYSHLGTPPPPYYHPIYHVISETQPPPYEAPDVYPAPAVPVAGMYQNPIVLQQPVIIGTPINPGNNNNNNIYLTNNIYYKTSEHPVDGQVEFRSDGKAAPLCSATSKEQSQQLHLLSQTPLQPHHLFPIPPLAFPVTAMEAINCNFDSSVEEGLTLHKCDVVNVPLTNFQPEMATITKSVRKQNNCYVLATSDVHNDKKSLDVA